MQPAFFALDTETTGLDDATDEIISIAIHILDEGFNKHSTKVVYAFPDCEVHPKAAAVNGYTREKWEANGAVSQIVLYTEVYEFVSIHRGLIPLGHNVKFDIGFLKALFKKNKGAYGRHFSYHSIDTLGVAIFADLALFGKKSSAYKLTDLCERFGIKLDNAHDALADIDATVELFRYLYTSLGGAEKRAEVPAPVVFSRMLGQKGKAWYIKGGKHKGEALTAISVDNPGYLRWMLKKLDDLSPVQREALNDALNNPTPAAPKQILQKSTPDVSVSTASKIPATGVPVSVANVNSVKGVETATVASALKGIENPGG